MSNHLNHHDAARYLGRKKMLRFGGVTLRRIVDEMQKAGIHISPENKKEIKTLEAKADRVIKNIMKEGVRHENRHEGN